MNPPTRSTPAMGPCEVPPAPGARPAGKVLFALPFLAILWSLARYLDTGALEPGSIFVSAMLIALFWPLAFQITAAFHLDADGITRTDLLGRSVRVAWSDVRRVSLDRGRFDFYTVSIRSRGKKFHWSRLRPGFFPALALVLEAAERHGISTRTAFGTGDIADWRALAEARRTSDGHP